MTDDTQTGGLIVAPIRTGAETGWLARLSKGLSKSSRQLSDQVATVLTKKKLDQDTLDELETMLIEADLGSAAAARVTEAFGRARVGKEATELEVKESLAEAITSELIHRQGRFEPLGAQGPPGGGAVRRRQRLGQDHHPRQDRRRPEGQGRQGADRRRRHLPRRRHRTAHRLGRAGGAPIIAKAPGADAAALAFEAVTRARDEGFDVVLIDTAGRLQNKQGLMDELAKIVRVLKKLDPAYPHETLLVLDATVGRNALSQIEAFDRIARVTGVVMTKLDGTARGGVLVPVAAASAAPIKLIGVGEGDRGSAALRRPRLRPFPRRPRGA